LGLGIAYGFTVAIAAGEGFPTFGLVLITAGMMLLALGFIADQISHWRLSTMEVHPIESGREKVSQSRTDVSK
jgi:hypothetical protein